MDTHIGEGAAEVVSLFGAEAWASGGKGILRSEDSKCPAGGAESSEDERQGQDRLLEEPARESAFPPSSQ